MPTPIWVEVNGLSGHLCNVEATAEWTVQQVRTAISQKTGIPYAQQTLIHGTEKLAPEVVLDSLVDSLEVLKLSLIVGQVPKTFSDLHLCAQLQENLEQQRYTDLTEFQQQWMPSILQRQDIVCSGQHGSGKTIAAVVCALNVLDVSRECCQALLITPTRDQSIRCQQVVSLLSDGMQIRSWAVNPRANPRPVNMAHALLGKHFVASGAGLIQAILDRGRLDLTELRMVILDGLGEMLARGFQEVLERLAAAVPPKVQWCVLSDSFSRSEWAFAHWALRLRAPALVATSLFHPPVPPANNYDPALHRLTLPHLIVGEAAAPDASAAAPGCLRKLRPRLSAAWNGLLEQLSALWQPAEALPATSRSLSPHRATSDEALAHFHQRVVDSITERRDVLSLHPEWRVNSFAAVVGLLQRLDFSRSDLAHQAVVLAATPEHAAELAQMACSSSGRKLQCTLLRGSEQPAPGHLLVGTPLRPLPRLRPALCVVDFGEELPLDGPRAEQLGSVVQQLRFERSEMQLVLLAAGMSESLRQLIEQLAQVPAGHIRRQLDRVVPEGLPWQRVPAPLD